MTHRRAQCFLVALVIAAVQMIEHSSASSALSRNREIRLDRVELQYIGYFAEEFSFQVSQLGLDRPHQLHAFRDERAQRLKSVAQLRPAVGAVQQFLEARLR